MIIDILDSKNLTLLKKQSKDLYYLKTSKKKKVEYSFFIFFPGHAPSNWANRCH